MSADHLNPNVWIVWWRRQPDDQKETVGVYETEALARERIRWVEDRHSFDENHETGTATVPIVDATEVPEWVWLVRTGTVRGGYTAFDRAYTSKHGAADRVGEIRASEEWAGQSVVTVNEWTVRSQRHFQSLP